MNTFFNTARMMFQFNGESVKPNQVSGRADNNVRPIMKEVHIHIGEYHASRNPIVIKTMVGSCVAVCLYDPIHKIGGMNHILLPGRADFKNYDAPARFGMNAMELLINRIMNLGGDRFNLVAKIFGGASVVAAISAQNGMGKKNTEFVFEFLERESIKVVSKDIGGVESRRIFFHTETGAVYLKRIRSNMSAMANEERIVLSRFRKEAKKPATIELYQNFSQLKDKKD